MVARLACFLAVPIFLPEGIYWHILHGASGRGLTQDAQGVVERQGVGGQDHRESGDNVTQGAIRVRSKAYASLHECQRLQAVCWEESGAQTQPAVRLQNIHGNKSSVGESVKQREISCFFHGHLA